VGSLTENRRTIRAQVANAIKNLSDHSVARGLVRKTLSPSARGRVVQQSNPIRPFRAMAAGVENRLWETKDAVEMVEAMKTQTDALFAREQG
jgi:hypothetical protein